MDNTVLVKVNIVRKVANIFREGTLCRITVKYPKPAVGMTNVHKETGLRVLLNDFLKGLEALDACLTLPSLDVAFRM